MPHEYGLTAAMQNKIAAKRDPEFEKAALKWIYGYLGEPVPEEPLEVALHDGQALLKFMKKVKPDLVSGPIHSGKIDAQLRENIGTFIQACTKLGVRGTDIFQTNDLWDKKDIPQVCVTLSALGTELQRNHPEVPAFGPPPKH
ncbi:muscle-specific protein 20-like [Paramacrobiotus metropolitanus]|uniref:muscle-specific protein 20-like n=1 Tax=Paramacrobiotus metropolitanus TaxID=2943436 RepID=UPI0024457CA1|nr:muscle-specific protein 20-like [Paramacrobiotus metropolitanus]